MGCSSGDGKGAGGATGAAGATGGSTGAAGMTVGNAGSGGATASGGSGGASGASGASGSGPVNDGGASPDGNDDGLEPSDVALTKRQTCPAGPFPAVPFVHAPTFVCLDAASLAALRYDTTGGPVWVPSEGAFFFSSYPSTSTAGSTSGDLVKVTLFDCSIVLRDVGTQGLTVAPDGRLIAASFKTSSISEIDLGTGRETVLVGASTGVKIGAPLDVVVSSNGSIYFSNVQAGAGTLATGVYRVDPMTGLAVPALSGLTFAPGTGAMALSPDEKTLLVFGAGRFNLTADGQFSSGGVDPITTGDSGAVAFDCANDIYVTTPKSGEVVTFTESPLVPFHVGSDLAFGGLDGTSILLVGQRSISVAQTNIPGVP